MRPALICLLSMLIFQYSQAVAFTLKEAVNLALQNNPALKETKEKINQARTEVPLAQSALYPNLNAFVTDNLVKDISDPASNKTQINPFTQYGASLKLNQTLFRRGSLSAIEAARLDVNISEIQIEINNRDLVNEVIQSFFQIILTQKNVETLQAQEKIALESVQVSNRRVHTGRSQTLDSLQAKTQLELIRGQLSIAQNNLQIANSNLASLLGLQNSNGLQVNNQLQVPSKSQVETLLKRNKVIIPEIQQSDYAIQKVENQIAILYGLNSPSLDLIGNYNFLNQKPPELFKNDSNAWSVGLQLTIPIFSGFSLREQNRSLLSQQMQLKFHKASIENQFSNLQSTNLKKLEIARNSIETGLAGLKLASDASAEARRNYRVATIDFLQYLSVQQAQAQAEQSLNAAKYSYIVALADSCAALGQDMKDLVEVLNQSTSDGTL